MTYLQLVNTVLRRLRFREVTSVSDSTYSKLIGDFINETKREVEDAWNWIMLRNTVQITTAANTFRYTLSGAGDRFRLLADRYGRVDVWNDTEDTYLFKAPSMRWMSARLNDDDMEINEPTYFDINGQDASSGDPQVDLWPIPDGVYTINFNMVIPQDDLEEDDDELTVPDWPVILGAWAKAIEERGEDGGASVQSVIRRYELALGDAINYEDANSAMHETTWTVV